MSASVNCAALIGRLTRDPEYRKLPHGGAECRLALATNHHGREGRTFTDYHDAVVCNQGQRRLADFCRERLRRGAPVYLEGRVQSRSWTDQVTGKRRWSTEIVLYRVVPLAEDDAAEVQLAEVEPVIATVKAELPGKKEQEEVDDDPMASYALRLYSAASGYSQDEAVSADSFDWMYASEE